MELRDAINACECIKAFAFNIDPTVSKNDLVILGEINSSILDDYVLKTYIGTLPNRVEPIYYTAEEIAAAEEGDAAYGKTTSDIKTPGTQYNNMVEAIEEGEEVAAAAIVDINNKISDISTRVSNIASGPSIWVGT